MGKSRKRTLICVRRAVTELKTTLADGIFEILAGSKASRASFNAKMAPSRPFGRWDLASMVEPRGGCEGRVWRFVTTIWGASSSGGASSTRMMGREGWNEE